MFTTKNDDNDDDGMMMGSHLMVLLNECMAAASGKLTEASYVARTNALARWCNVFEWESMRCHRDLVWTRAAEFVYLHGSLVVNALIFAS